MQYSLISLVRWFVAAALCTLLWGCAAKPLSRFEVQHPARLTIKKEIRTVFIDPNKINATNDDLRIKNLVIRKLQRELNRFGRFKTVIGPVAMENPEKDTVALIQGDVISGELVEDAQFTEVATCKGGIRGFAGGLVAAKASDRGVTVSRRGYPCRATDFKSEVISAGVGGLFALAGIEMAPDPVDEVIRVYKAKNISMFAQLNFSFTEIGKQRETIAIRSDSASFGRQIVESAENVHETYMTMAEAAPLLVSPFSPLFVRKFAVVDATNPGTFKGRIVHYTVPSASHIPAKERTRVLNSLADESLKTFIRTISPYKITAYIQIAESGSEKAIRLIKKGEWKKARTLLQKSRSRSPADEYNYGLTFEGGAESMDDYRTAKELYLSALNSDPDNFVYAQGIGRMERRLKEFKKNQAQTL